MKGSLLSLVALAGCPSNWRKLDTAAELAAVTTTVMDWSQTRRIVAACDEENPIIGGCGENVNVDLYFTAMVVTEAVASRILSGSWRTLFQGAWIGVEGKTVGRNMRNGWSIIGGEPGQ